MSDYLELPPKIDRIPDQKYMYKNEIVIWNGKRLLCEHKRRRIRCRDCGGSQICEHNIQRSTCRDCGGSSICEHKRRRSRCRDCGGSSICKHNRIRSRCTDCGGGEICEHNRRRSQCTDCGGTSICEHGKRKEFCKDCGGSQICEHNRIRRRCSECDRNGYLISLVRGRVYHVLKNYSTRRDKKHTLEYVGCSVEDLRTHLENQFEKEAERCGHPISWENQGEWHIDHIKPCASFDLDLEEERDKCFHYTNLQPMWGPDNISKSDTYDEDDDERIWMGRINGWVG
jgi:hypothetical protein